MVTNILQIINVQFKENISLDNKKIQYVTKINTSISDICFQCLFFLFYHFLFYTVCLLLNWKVRTYN